MRRIIIVGLAIILLAVICAGCAETVPLEEYDAKVAEYEGLIDDIEAEHDGIHLITTSTPDLSTQTLPDRTRATV